MFGSGTTNHKQRVEDLLQEQNQLLRELIFALTGRQSQIPKRQPLPQGYKPRTANDVTLVTRETLLEQQRKAEAKEAAESRTNEPLGRS